MNIFIRGNDRKGYWAEFGKNEAILHGSGEFTAIFSDETHSVKDHVRNWKATSVTKTNDGYILEGKVELEELKTDVYAVVQYKQINEYIVNKKISFNSNKDLYYCLNNRLDSKVDVDQHWSFEQSNVNGGPVYEIFPAIGLTVNGVNYGLLTDNGYRNRWTRISRQTDGHGYLVSLDYHPDPELTYISSREERLNGRNYVQYKFGEVIDYTSTDYQVISLPSINEWNGINGTAITAKNGIVAEIENESTDSGGIEVPIELEKNGLYEIHLKYQSKHNLSIRVLNEDVKTYFEWGKELGAYQDGLPSTDGSEIKDFSRKFIASRVDGQKQIVTLKLMKDINSDVSSEFALIDLQIRKYSGKKEEFHKLERNSENLINLFLFESDAATHRQLQIDAQVRLAEGLGFVGTEAEKIMYANNQMLVWIAQHDRLLPHVVPSLNYHPDMYMRDSFWQINAVNDKDVSEKGWIRFAETQHPDGQLDTLARAYRYAPSTDDNDSTMFFIIWAYVNKIKYGLTPQMEPLKKALNNIRMNHCPKHDGKYISSTAGWFDTIWGDSIISSINQGHFAVTLRCAYELGLDIQAEEIESAKQAYRDLYLNEEEYMPWSEIQDYMSPSVLLGEFLNWWLFDEGILSSEMVVNTVEKLPVIKRGVPCISDRNGKLFTDENKPWEEKYGWRKGVYHNGGSWFLYEYLAYVAAACHGWEKASDRMEWRLEMEFSKEDEPFSHEFIPLTDDEEDWWPTCRVFGWNTFMIEANKVVKRNITKAKRREEQ